MILPNRRAWKTSAPVDVATNWHIYATSTNVTATSSQSMAAISVTPLRPWWRRETRRAVGGRVSAIFRFNNIYALKYDNK